MMGSGWGFDSWGVEVSALVWSSTVVPMPALAPVPMWLRDSHVCFKCDKALPVQNVYWFWNTLLAFAIAWGLALDTT